jgi:hypothetical protein
LHTESVASHELTLAVGDSGAFGRGGCGDGYSWHAFRFTGGNPLSGYSGGSAGGELGSGGAATVVQSPEIQVIAAGSGEHHACEPLNTKAVPRVDISSTNGIGGGGGGIQGGERCAGTSGSVPAKNNWTVSDLDYGSGAGGEGHRGSISLTYYRAPDAPTNLQGQVLTDKTVKIDWTASYENASPVESYRTEFSKDGVSWTPVPDQDIAYAGVSAVISHLSVGSSYQFRVHAVNSYGDGLPSTPSGVITVALPPSAPQSVRFSGRTSHSVDLVWSLADNGGLPISGVSVQRSQDLGATWVNVANHDIQHSTPGANYATVGGLDTGKTYVFRVRVAQDVGVSSWSDLSAQALAASVPSKATSVYATSKSASSVSIAWSPSTDNGSPVTNYLVQISDDSGLNWRNLLPHQLVRANATDTIAKIIGLNTGAAYLFRVTPVSAEGTGQPTAIGEPVLVVGVPSGPTNLHFTQRSASSIGITWTAPFDGGRAITNYAIQQSADGGTWVDVALNSIARSQLTDTSVVVGDLHPGGRYSFRVRAINSEGPSEWSDSSTKGLAASSPETTTNVQVTGKDENSVSLRWISPEANGSEILRYLIEVQVDDSQTWTAVPLNQIVMVSPTSNSGTVIGLVRGHAYLFRVAAVNGEGIGLPTPLGAPVIPSTVPSGVRGLQIVTNTTESVSIQWSSPGDDGGIPVNNFQFRYSRDGGNSWILADDGWIDQNVEKCKATIHSLAIGQNYSFEVRAINPNGAGTWSSQSSEILTAAIPNQVTGLSLASRSSLSIAIGWSAPADNGAALNTYLVRTSSDNGVSWSSPINIESVGTTYLLSGLPSAAARLVQVAAINVIGEGPWSDSFLATTKGAKLVRVTVRDSAGQPVTGGAITWRMSDNSAWSAKTYGLTADGIIDFPYAPAGSVNVTLTNGQMSDGTLVSGTWASALGFTTATLTVPDANTYAVRTAHVQLPNGYPVANVQVTVSGSGLSSEYHLGGFNFVQPTSASSGFTDTAGNFTVTGFWSGDPLAKTMYNDGIIIQQQTNPMVGSVTTIELDYMPWVSFDYSQVTGDVGAPQVVQVSAVDSEGSNLRGRHYLNSAAPVKAGVAVTLVPPKGVKASKCANGKSQKLTGITGASGKAKLTICAFKSGIYTLKTAGAASVGSIRVLVKGAAPLAPTSVNVTSPVVGQLRASWNKPLYDGGSPITQYTISATAKGKPTVTKVIKATLNKKGVVTKAPSTVQVLTGLSNATVYTVTITATTKNGTSETYSLRVPVA